MRVPNSQTSKRKSFFFGENGHKLFAIHFQGTPGNPAAILCQPYGDEALKTRRVFFNIAEEWSSKGIDVLLFDYFGTGNSQGEFEQLRWEGMLKDIRSAIDEICRLTSKDKVILAGLRLGATASALVADQDKRIGSVVLWSPIVEGEEYLKKILRINLTTQTVASSRAITNTKQLLSKIQKGEPIDINGYILTKEFYDAVKGINLKNMVSKFKGQVIIVQISQRLNDKISPEYIELKKLHETDGVICELLTAVEKPFWIELNVFYQKASDMLSQTEKALRI